MVLSVRRVNFSSTKYSPLLLKGPGIRGVRAQRRGDDGSPAREGVRSAVRP
jgi:hypothetical protein